jgi:hypothetical protein
VKNPEVPKSRVNPDCSSKGTCVYRLACSGIRHSGETKCDRVKTPEVPKSRVNPDRSLKGHVSTDQLVWEFDVREKLV